MSGRMWIAMALVLASGGLAGCINLQVFPAEIPVASLAPGWARDAGNSQSGTVGQEPLVRAHYHVNAYRDGGSESLTNPEGPGVALLVSVPDAPIVDEQAEVQRRVDALVAENNVQLTERQGGTGTVGGQTVSYRLFDATVPFRGGSARGLAIDISYKCAANGQHVRLFGYAVTEISGLTGRSMTTWRELAGQAEGGTLGGMLTAVRCS